MSEPSDDPIGTVRRGQIANWGEGTVVKISGSEDQQPWRLIPAAAWPLWNSEVVACPVIGAVPGTPADTGARHVVVVDEGQEDAGPLPEMFDTAESAAESLATVRRESGSGSRMSVWRMVPVDGGEQR